MSISKSLHTKMEKTTTISPFRLSSLLRLEKDPNLAFRLFLNPNPSNPDFKFKPFHYSHLSYDLIISKLGRAKMFDKMETIMEKLKSDKRVSPKEIIFCNIIQYYARSRLIDKAHQVFDEMPKFRCRPTIKSFNTLLNCFLIRRDFDKMSELLNNVRKYGDPDVCTFNILINACFLRGYLDEEWWGMLVEIQRGGVQPNVVSFSTLINGLCRNSQLDQAFKLESDMVRDFGITPNLMIYAALIKGLCGAGKVDEAIKLIDDVMLKEYKFYSAIYTTLISALFKEGRKGEVDKLCKEMEQSGCKRDTATYNALISGSCTRKEFDVAFQFLNEMEKNGPKPDVISYNVIIRGLSGEGKIRDAVSLFEDMPRRKCIPDEVTYRVIFDGLREGYMFRKAALVLDKMVGKRFAPRSESINKLVDGLIREEDVELLWNVLYSLGKVNGINFDVWRSVVSMVCGQELSSYSSTLEVVDSLVMDRLKGQNQSLYE